MRTALRATLAAKVARGVILADSAYYINSGFRTTDHCRSYATYNESRSRLTTCQSNMPAACVRYGI